MIFDRDEWRQMPPWQKAMFLVAATLGFAISLGLELISCSGRT